MRRRILSSAALILAPCVAASAQEVLRYGDLAQDATAYEITLDTCEIRTVFQDRVWPRTPWETTVNIAAHAPLDALDLAGSDDIQRRADRTTVVVPLAEGAPSVIHTHQFLAGPQTGIERLFQGETYTCTQQSCTVFIDRDALVFVAMGADHQRTAIDMVATIANHAILSADPS